MSTPALPWYGKLRSIVAPTDDAARLALFALIVISIVILVAGDPVIRAAWVIYLVSP